MVTAARPRARRARLWWRVHQWAGLQVCLFLTFVFLTGTLAVFSYEIDWALRPAMWVDPARADGDAGWGDYGAAVLKQAPSAEIIAVNAPLHPAAAVDVVVREGTRLPHHVYVHPGTGEVQGRGDWAGVQRFLRNTHRHLMLPVKWGVSIVSLAALLLLVSLVTSFAVYKAWWRGFFRWPRGRTLRALTGDAHRFLGVWSIWFITIFIATGVWYLAEVWGAAAPLPARPDLPPVEALPPPDTLARNLDAGLAQIAQELPGYRVASVLWPTRKFPVFMVQGDSGRAALVRPRVDSFWIDAASGRVIGRIDPRTLSAHQRLAEAADPLHFGTWGGYGSRAVWFLFGAALTAMAATGVAIYVLRLGRGPAGQSGAGSSRWLTAWRSMGRARWLALALCLLPFGLAPFVL